MNTRIERELKKMPFHETFKTLEEEEAWIRERQVAMNGGKSLSSFFENVLDEVEIQCKRRIEFDFSPLYFFSFSSSSTQPTLKSSQKSTQSTSIKNNKTHKNQSKQGTKYNPVELDTPPSSPSIPSPSIPSPSIPSPSSFQFPNSSPIQSPDSPLIDNRKKTQINIDIPFYHLPSLYSHPPSNSSTSHSFIPQAQDKNLVPSSNNTHARLSISNLID